MSAENYRHIVRVANTDLNGKKCITIALQKIKGIGDNAATAICRLAGVELKKQTGKLTDAEVKTLTDAINNFDKKAPKWMLNRNKDIETGDDKHLFSSDLKFTQQSDVKRMMMCKTYRGLRHQWGLPLRGQRTASNFRPSKAKASKAKKRS